MKTNKKSNDPQSGKAKGKLFLYIRFLAICAASALFLAIGTWCYLSFKVYRHSTNSNKQTILLRDGSEIVLNHNSSIHYNAGFGLINRKVTLSGEAFIKTKKGRYFPFVVETSVARLKVTGTLFDVRATNNKTEVGVSEGSVLLSPKNKRKAAITIAKGFYSWCEAGMSPGKTMELPYAGYPDWMNNRFEYQNAELKRILSEMEAHFCIKIEVKDPQILNQKYSGTIEGASPEVILQTLAVQIDRSMSFNNNTYQIY